MRDTGYGIRDNDGRIFTTETQRTQRTDTKRFLQIIPFASLRLRLKRLLLVRPCVMPFIRCRSFRIPHSALRIRLPLAVVGRRSSVVGSPSHHPSRAERDDNLAIEGVSNFEAHASVEGGGHTEVGKP